MARRAATLLILIAALAALGCTPVPSTSTSESESGGDVEPRAEADEPADAGTADDETADGETPDGAPVTADGSGNGVEVEVGRIIDGDSLELLVDGAEVEVRIVGINTPELYTLGDEASCPGDRARTEFRSLTDAAETLRFEAGEEDRFGRTLGVIVADGVPVTDSMVQSGWALALWSSEDEGLIALMREAADAERGIWGDECGTPASDDLRFTETQLNAPGDDRENLNGEWVTVTNTGDDAVDLEGWTIRDETTSNRFLIEDLQLGPGDSVRFISGSGSNGGGDYHLGESFPVWSNRGETVLLVDPDGLVAAYSFVSG